MFNQDVKKRGNRELTGYPSIDRPWEKYYNIEDIKIKVPKCTVYQNVYECNRNYLDSIAIQYLDNKISYEELFIETENCAKSLKEIGIKKGDCVTLCTAGVPEAIYIVLACSRIGAIANFINPLFSKEQTTDRINDTGAEWVFVLDELYDHIAISLPETCIKNIVIIPIFNAALSKYDNMINNNKAKEIIGNKKRKEWNIMLWKSFKEIGKSYQGALDVSYEPNMPTIMVYSSGSTGASKGILLTNDGILATNYNRNIPSFPAVRGESFLQIIPVWFSTGIVLSILVPLLMGLTVIPEPLFGKESFCRDLIKYKPNLTLAATSLWLYVISSKDTEKTGFSFLKCPITGGEKVLPQDEDRINAFFREHNYKGRIFKGYGMCELGGTVTSSSPNKGYKNKPCGTGYPLRNIIVSAFDVDTNQECMYFERGEIRVCSPSRMKGYFKNIEATENYFWKDDEGNIWGCTGDIGYIDEDGEVYILGRANDSFRNEEGKIIYLFDIEDQILKNEEVNQCKVVDIKEDGRIKLAAHIVLKESSDDVKSCVERIRSSLSELLPLDMRPDYYKVRHSMPVHTNGKRDVEALRMDLENLL